MEYYRSPYRTRNAFSLFVRQIPPGTRWILIACVVVFLLQTIARYADPGVFALMISGLGLTPALFVRGWIFQAVTYMFLHGDLGHIGFNMLSFWMFGSEMERTWGTRRFLTYYTICGVGAALTTVAFDPFSPQPTIGASGAILGVLLAYGMTFPDRTILFNFFIPMRARTFIILLIGMQVLFFHSYMASGIAVVAHLGGMLFGYLYLKKVWRVRALAGEIRWRLRRRRFRVVGRKEHERFPFN